MIFTLEWGFFNMIIESFAPTRVDLAGATVDVAMMHLFYNNPVTLNFATNQYAKVKLTTRDDKKINITCRFFNRNFSVNKNIQINYSSANI